MYRDRQVLACEKIEEQMESEERLCLTRRKLSERV